MHILVTGGTGFIGSHTVLQILEHLPDASVHIIDNFWNSFPAVLPRMKELAGPKADRIAFDRVDLRDKAAMEAVFSRHTFDACIHFAGLKAVGESVQHPLWYYSNNVEGTTVLLQCMDKFNCKNMVFSSSCTVYGMPEKVPLTEDHRLKAISPYGNTKLIIEDMLRDVVASDKSWKVILLRYFNPVGAHPSGRIGENPTGIPNNLMPYVQKVALGQLPVLSVFGNDYNTRDGTAVRDYIHVMDLADAHVAALRRLSSSPPDYGCKAINVGTGRGSTVLEMVEAFKKVTGADVPYKFAPRRPGDSEAVWAATDLCESELGWKARYGLEDMVRDQWKWAQGNPQGYDEEGRGEVDAGDWRKNHA